MRAPYTAALLILVHSSWALPAGDSPAPPATATAETVSTTPLAIRHLPEHLRLRFAVLYGDDGFKLGTTTYTWKAADGRYSLMSVAQASGLAALVMNGNVVNSSEGRITRQGLMPEHFWISRKNERKEFAQFDWPGQRLELPEGRVEALPAQAQDILSFVFHLAMTASNGTWNLAVSNGKNLKDYRFSVVGIERMEVMGKPADTLHLQGVHKNEGNTDVWLGMNAGWLPVRIRNVDAKGKTIVQSLLQIQR